MSKEILSLFNEKIKTVASLKEKKYRDSLGLFVGEGLRFTETALNSDFEIVYAFFEPKILKTDRGKSLIESLEEKIESLYEVSEKIMQKISNTKTPQGILAVIKQKDAKSENIKSGSIFTVLDNVKDPGNAGTIVRLSDAVGAGVAIFTKNCVDAYSDKVIRATMGSVFNVPIIRNADKDFIVNFAKDRNLKIYATKTNAQTCYETNLKCGGIFVFGSESDGVSEDILSVAECISLPIVGNAESLNVASAASAILYEAYRQEKYVGL